MLKLGEPSEIKLSGFEMVSFRVLWLLLCLMKYHFKTNSSTEATNTYSDVQPPPCGVGGLPWSPELSSSLPPVPSSQTPRISPYFIIDETEPQGGQARSELHPGRLHSVHSALPATEKQHVLDPKGLWMNPDI